MAKYNVDVEVQAKTSAAERKLDSLAKTLSNLQQVAGKVSETLNTKNAWNAGHKASQDLGNVFDRVAKAGRSAATAITDGLQKALLGITSYQVLALDTHVRNLATHLPLVGKSIAETTTGPFQQFIQSVGNADIGIAALTVGLMAFGPQAVEATFKAAGGLLDVSRKAGRVTNNVLSIIPGFKKVGNAAQQSNGSVINGLEGLQAALRKAQEEQEKFDNSLRGAPLKQLNDVTREAKKTLEGYWSMTGKAEKAAENYAKALKAQKLEQEEINRLVKEAKEGLPLTESEKKEAAVALAAQKELALAEKAQQKKKEDHERRLRKFDRDRVKAAKARTKIDEEAQRAQRLREGLMLGVGFPLLFGGGPGSILGGGAGALVQSQLGKGKDKGKGFGAQIALSAAGGQIDRLVATIVKGMIEVGKAVTTTAGAYAFLEEKTLFSSKKIKERAAKLKEQGDIEALNILLTEEYIRLVGREGFEALQDAGTEAQNLKTAWEELTIAMSALMAGPLGDMLKLATRAVDTKTSAARLKLLQQDLAGQGDTEAVAKMQKAINKYKFGDGQFGAIGGVIGNTIKNRRFSGPGRELTGAEMDAIYKEFSPLRKTDGVTIPDPGDLGKGKGNKLTETQKIAAERERLELVFQYGEREAAIRTKIKKIHADINSEKALALRKDLETIDQLKDMNELYKGIGQTIKDGLVEGINAAIDGTKTLGEIASNVFRHISNQLISYGIDASLGSIPGLEKIFGRASGGPVKGGSPYVVGEKGPELFVPGSSGNIVPNHAMGGANVVVNVDASGSSAEGDADTSRQLGELIGAAIQSELVKQKRPGGILY